MWLISKLKQGWVWAKRQGKKILIGLGIVGVALAIGTNVLPPEQTESPELTEIISQRTENSKTYNLGGNKRALNIYIGAIHYKDNYADSNEPWKEIDLTWESNKIIKAPYILEKEGNKITITDKKTSEISTIELINIKPADILFGIIPGPSAVRFQHILPSAKIPFEAKFKITGKVPITRAFDDEGALELETSFIDGILTEKLTQVKDKETGQVRPAKGSIRIDPTWQVGTSTDDTRRVLGGNLWDLTNEGFAAGYYNTTYYQYGSGGRFTNITIPQGTTIDSAYLTLRSISSGYAGTVVRSRISAEDVDDAPTFADDATAFDNRWAARTTARVDWDSIPAWTLDVDYDSPSIVSVIQEIVDRALWASGNDMVIFWEDFDDRSDHNANAVRLAYSYDSSTEFAPKLVVTYTVAIAEKKITPPVIRFE